MATTKKKTIIKSSPSQTKINNKNLSEDFILFDRLSKQVFLLFVLSIAIFIFSLYLFWKIRQFETKLDTLIKTAQNQQRQQQPKNVQVKIDQIKKLFSKDYLAFGDNKRKVLFVEFSDPSCPYCHLAAGNNPELNQQAGGQFLLESQGGTYKPPVKEMKRLVDERKASYVYLYRNGHGNGQLAAEALYCANDQNKFWEVHDLLMSNEGYNIINNTIRNDRNNIPQLVDFLSSIVDTTAIANCLNQKKHANKISRDTDIGDELGVGGTPGFFINTTNFPGAYSFSEMEPVVKQALSN